MGECTAVDQCCVRWRRKSVVLAHGAGIARWVREELSDSVVLGVAAMVAEQCRFCTVDAQYFLYGRSIDVSVGHAAKSCWRKNTTGESGSGLWDSSWC